MSKQIYFSHFFKKLELQIFTVYHLNFYHLKIGISTNRFKLPMYSLLNEPLSFRQDGITANISGDYL